MIRPVLNAVFVRPDPASERAKIGSIFLPDLDYGEGKGARSGVVVAAGPGYRGKPLPLIPLGRDGGQVISAPLIPLEVKEGDRVLLDMPAEELVSSRFAEWYPMEGERVLIVGERHIDAVIGDDVQVGQVG